MYANTYTCATHGDYDKTKCFGFPKFDIMPTA